jgi:hypothetical protein
LPCGTAPRAAAGEANSTATVTRICSCDADIAGMASYSPRLLQSIRGCLWLGWQASSVCLSYCVCCTHVRACSKLCLTVLDHLQVGYADDRWVIH